MAKPEKIVEDYLVEQTEARGGWCAKMVDVGRLGAPDRELRMNHGVLIFAETKPSKAEKLRVSQNRYADKLKTLGFEVVALHSKADVDQLFARYDRGYYDH